MNDVLKRKHTEYEIAAIFIRRNAHDALKDWPACMPRAQLVLTSPPYYGCRDYSKEGTDNALGGTHTGADDALGHENTPYAFARNLADVFGDAAAQSYLQADGSLVVVLGDTFARKRFVDAEKRYAPIAERSSIGIQHLFVNEMRLRGWRLWQECIWDKPSVAPSNAAQKRCNPVHEYMLWFDANTAQWPKSNMKAVREAGKTAAGTVMPPVGGKKYGTNTKTLVSDGKRARRDVFSVCPSRDKSAHVAPFPEALVEVWMEALSEKGDVVCDPFAGTRTTERVALRLGRRSVAFDVHDWKNGGKLTA